MTTLARALTVVRERLDEVAPGGPSVNSAWPDAQLRQWIMEGCNDIARQTESLQARATITTVATVQEYTLPVDLIRLTRIEYTPPDAGSNYPLEIVSLRSGDSLWYGSRTTARGRPQYVTLEGFPPSLKAILYPTPDATSGTLTVFYYRLPDQLATNGDDDASTLEVPAGWEDLVYEYATALALQRDANESWQQHRAIYEDRLGTLLHHSRDWHDQSDSIVPDLGGVGGITLLGGYNDDW